MPNILEFVKTFKRLPIKKKISRLCDIAESFINVLLGENYKHVLL